MGKVRKDKQGAASRVCRGLVISHQVYAILLPIRQRVESANPLRHPWPTVSGETPGSRFGLVFGLCLVPAPARSSRLRFCS